MSYLHDYSILHVYFFKHKFPSYTIIRDLRVSISRTSKITTKYQISADREKNKKIKFHLDPNPRAPQRGPKQK